MHAIRTPLRAVLAAALTLAAGCSGSAGDGSAGPTGPTGPAGTLAEQLQVLSTRRVFFGHQSVGNNIMGGLATVLAGQSGARPAIAHTVTPGDLSAGTFAHYEIPDNGNPDHKIANFGTLLAGDLGGAVDVAFLKFCFVDFEGRSDANLDALFTAYQQMVASIHAAHPGLKLVHLTVPLSPSDDPNNACREKFSAKLRAAYGSDVFDLATFESTDPATGVQRAGTYGPRLLDAWKGDDSGHLDAAGSQAVAKALVAFLAGK